MKARKRRETPVELQHRKRDPRRPRGGDGGFVAGVGVTCDADSGIVGEHALESDACVGRAIGDDYLTGMQRVADADASTVVEGYPRGTARDIEQRIENRPV